MNLIIPLLFVFIGMLHTLAADAPRHYRLQPPIELRELEPSPATEKGRGFVIVRNVTGEADYRTPGGEWTPVRVGFKSPESVTFRTKASTSMDLFLADNGPVIRMTQQTTLQFVRLRVENTGIEKIIETQLYLSRGRILGNVKKMAKASVYEIKTPIGVAGIRGTEYSISASGTVDVSSGALLYWDRRGKKSVNLQAGQSIFPRAEKSAPSGSLFEKE